MRLVTQRVRWVGEPTASCCCFCFDLVFFLPPVLAVACLAAMGKGKIGVCWWAGFPASVCFKDEGGQRGSRATAEAERGENETAARLQKVARAVKRGLRATIIRY